MDRIFVSPDQLALIRNEAIRSGRYIMAGHSSVTIPNKVKYIDQNVVRPWDIGNGPELVTPGEAARYELKREFPNLKRVGWFPPMISLFDKRSPMLYSGPESGSHYTYIDLTSAYHQIYSKLWLDVMYPRGLGGRLPLAGVAARLKPWKPARNAIVGIARSRFITGYKGTRVITMQNQNPYLSPGLWATVQDILNWVADRAVVCGATYINTDGYLFNNDDSADKFMAWLINRSFIFKVRARGSGNVKGWNVYRVGKFQTKLYDLWSDSTKPFISIERTKDYGRYWSFLSKKST